MQPIIKYIQTKLREAGPRRFASIAAETGVSESLLPKLAYGMRDNPRVQTIQPLLDYFDQVDRGVRACASEGPVEGEKAKEQEPCVCPLT